jgi:uncharacterized protein YbaA (DUF1428 family)
MAGYVDGFVFTVPKKNLAAYKKMARLGAKVWREHGAVDYRECIGDDVKTFEGMGPPFPKLVKAKPGDVVGFSYIVFKSKADRNRVNAKVMKDPRMTPPEKSPIDLRKMSYGGFKVFVE